MGSLFQFAELAAHFLFSTLLGLTPVCQLESEQLQLLWGWVGFFLCPAIKQFNVSKLFVGYMHNTNQAFFR